jgi:uncharacterized membrane protein
MTRRLSWVAVAVLAGVAVSAPRGAAQGPPTYTPVFLSDVSGVSRLNDLRQIAGWSSVGSGDRGWVASPAQGLSLLPLPANSLSSMVTDMNAAGVVVGSVSPYTSSLYWGEAAAWYPDGSGGYTVKRLGMLPGHVWSRATAVNNVGDIVGFSSDGTFRLPVLFTNPGGILDLTPTGVFDPKGINDRRVLVDAFCHRLDLDTMILDDLGLPPGHYRATVGEAINASDQVVGSAINTTGTHCDHEAASYTDGVGWEILSSCGSVNSAYDVNGGGDVVMQLNLAPYVRFEGLGLFDIESLIQSPVGHWDLWNTYQLGIDDQRELAVLGSNATTGESGLLLLIPDSVCQPDLGFGGPGNVTLSVCGGNLSAGTTANLLVTGAVPNQLGFLLAGLAKSAVPFGGGTLVPIPLLAVVPLKADASGNVHLPNIPGGGGLLTIYLQFVDPDAAQPKGYRISNAVEVDFLF